MGSSGSGSPRYMSLFSPTDPLPVLDGACGLTMSTSVLHCVTAMPKNSDEVSGISVMFEDVSTTTDTKVAGLLQEYVTDMKY